MIDYGLIKKRWLSFINSKGYANKKSVLPRHQLYNLGLIYSVYRVIISLFLFLSEYTVVFETRNVFVAGPSFLQRSILLFYCIVSLFSFATYALTQRHHKYQLTFGLILDVIVLSLLLYTNGSPDLQTTMLYMVVVAASFMLLPPYQGLIITLFAIILVIYQQFFYALSNTISLSNLGDTLLLSFSFLAVASISWTVSQRLAQVERIASNHAQELEKLNAINKEVISKMSNGVLVVDNAFNVVISNTAAISLLDLEADVDKIKLNTSKQLLASEPRLNQVVAQTLAIKHPKLAENFDAAVKVKQSQFIYRLPTASNITDHLRLNTTLLQDSSLLIIIEDLRREQSNMQQLKLASLGQLTASIAHEIRNPLAAISQASQLLIEDSSQGGAQNQDFELYQIIFNQTKRVNRIIEDVLKLSRQTKPKQTKIELVPWLEQFVFNYFQAHNIRITAKCEPYIYFDTHHLEQILINLINNGLRYSRKSNACADVELAIECIQNNVILDILDTGEGVSDTQLPNLFHPFFTTDNDGTGLGLYLSQAFTEANQARLIYVPEHDKTCFRLLISEAAA